MVRKLRFAGKARYHHVVNLRNKKLGWGNVGWSFCPESSAPFCANGNFHRQRCLCNNVCDQPCNKQQMVTNRRNGMCRNPGQNWWRVSIVLHVCWPNFVDSILRVRIFIIAVVKVFSFAVGHHKIETPMFAKLIRKKRTEWRVAEHLVFSWLLNWLSFSSKRCCVSFWLAWWKHDFKSNTTHYNYCPAALKST